ncbi:unnamed protein product [Allacma fusca]|uniref:Aldose 1-epimerase n=1 Tax=Allacma fusca TaxID=39272 RepID=A0A8J2LDT6_9HEXA|nr:unnamed protein product [Allacma fusca]
MAEVEIMEDTFGFIVDPNNPDSKEIIRRFTLTNKSGTSAQIITYGATLTSLKVRDKNGQLDDIVLGFDDINGYLGKLGRNPYFGATIGRTANRTAKAQFLLGNQTYVLNANNGPNHLHGGNVGFDKRLWESHVEGKRVTFSYVSRDGEEGYPGEVLANVTYELTSDNQLVVQFQATSTKPTPINLTNHSYFNLSGNQFADRQLRAHHVLLNADHYTPVDDTLIPTGEIVSVEGTVYDLRTNKNLHDLLQQFPGYDNNFCLNRNAGEQFRLAARVQEQNCGRVLEVYTDQPGVQFYTSNFLPDKDPLPGKQGAKYFKHGAFCLETQNYPNAINQANFPDPVIKPGAVYTHKVVYRFFTAPS